MTGARGSSTDDDASDLPLEVIELEPSSQPSRGREPANETLPRRRGPVVIAVVVIVALVVVTIASRTRHSSGRGASSTTDARQTEIDGTPGNPTALFPFRVGAELLTGGAAGLRLVDTDTGRVTVASVPGLPAGAVAIVAHSGSTVAVRADAQLYWFSLPNGVAHRVDADTAFAAATPGSLWLADQRVATEVPGDRDRLPRTHVATTGPAIGATSAGLLVATKAGIVVQPTTGIGDARLLLRAPATVIGVHADRVAWVANECGVLRCPVHVTEVATGATSSWLQLVGHPSPLAVAGSSGVFSPDGGSIAIAVPNDDVTGPRTLVVADLRTRATIVVDARGQFEEPARPGSADATGVTIDWTLDGAFLVLGASEVGSDRISALKPTSPLVTLSGSVPAVGTTAAAIGRSSAGALDLARHGETGPIDSGGPNVLGITGLHLVGADARQVDVLDTADGRVTTWSIAGPAPEAASPNAIARVVGGWLVVRVRGGSLVVDRLPDSGGPAREIADGTQVFAAVDGRQAWITSPLDGARAQVHSYDPTTGAIGTATTAGTPVGAVDRGVVVTRVAGPVSREIDVVDAAGRVRYRTVVLSTDLSVLAAGGDTIAYSDEAGLHVLELATGSTRLIAPGPVDAAALSPDGTVLAWIGADPRNADTSRVEATRVGSAGVTEIGGPADRVLVADNGTVLFTTGADLRLGRLDHDRSQPVSELAPDSAAALALG